MRVAHTPVQLDGLQAGLVGHGEQHQPDTPLRQETREADDRRPRIGRQRWITGVQRRLLAPPDDRRLQEPRPAHRRHARRVEQPPIATDHRLAVAEAPPARQRRLHVRACQLARRRGLVEILLELLDVLLGRRAPEEIQQDHLVALQLVADGLADRHRVDEQQERDHQQARHGTRDGRVQDPATQLLVVRRIGRAPAVRSRGGGLG